MSILIGIAEIIVVGFIAVAVTFYALSLATRVIENAIRRARCG